MLSTRYTSVVATSWLSQLHATRQYIHGG